MFEIFGLVSGRITTIITDMKTLFGWIGQLGTSLANLVLPDWLMPGSPTPLELGLRGINSAMKDMRMRDWNMTGSPNGGSPVFLTLNYAPAVSLASREEVDTKLRPFVERALRGHRGSL